MSRNTTESYFLDFQARSRDSLQIDRQLQTILNATPMQLDGKKLELYFYSQIETGNDKYRGDRVNTPPP